MLEAPKRWGCAETREARGKLLEALGRLLGGPLACHASPNKQNAVGQKTSEANTTNKRISKNDKTFKLKIKASGAPENEIVNLGGYPNTFLGDSKSSWEAHGTLGRPLGNFLANQASSENKKQLERRSAGENTKTIERQNQWGAWEMNKLRFLRHNMGLGFFVFGFYFS